LRRNIPSFTVEVRRQPRRASNSTANGRLFETAPVRSAFDRDTQRAADAVFESKEPDQPVVDATSAAPKGRILPSLVVDDSANRSFREDSPEDESEQTPGVAKRRSARLQKPPKLPKPRRRSGSPTHETAPLVDFAASGSVFMAREAEGIFVSPGEPAAASNKPAGNAAGPGLRKEPKKRAKKPTPNGGLAAWLAEPEPLIPLDIPRTPPSAAGNDSPKDRKRTIMGRYVVGDEFKPGERWKRLLRKPR
jgi:hypothetical protein